MGFHPAMLAVCFAVPAIRKAVWLDLARLDSTPPACLLSLQPLRSVFRRLLTCCVNRGSDRPVSFLLSNALPIQPNAHIPHLAFAPHLLGAYRHRYQSPIHG